DDDEDHVLAAVAKLLGHLHEDVEAAHRLEAAGNIGDDAHVVGNYVLADLARRTKKPGFSKKPGFCGARTLKPRSPQLGVDAVEDDADFVVKLFRQPAALPLGRAVAGVAIVEVE